MSSCRKYTFRISWTTLRNWKKFKLLCKFCHANRGSAVTEIFKCFPKLAAFNKYALSVHNWMRSWPHLLETGRKKFFSCVKPHTPLTMRTILALYFMHRQFFPWQLVNLNFTFRYIYFVLKDRVRIYKLRQTGQNYNRHIYIKT